MGPPSTYDTHCTSCMYYYYLVNLGFIVSLLHLLYILYLQGAAKKWTPEVFRQLDVEGFSK